MTCRPEFKAAWADRDGVVTIPLGRLDPASVRALITRLAGDKSLPRPVVEQIATNTDGVPLYIEELTKMVLESEVLRHDGERLRLHESGPRIGIPATLQDSMMARLDRMAPVRNVAQVAAAIGREFSFQLLHKVAGRDTATLNLALARLEDARIATVLCNRFPTVAETEPEVIAHHFTCAGQNRVATEWWSKAGHRAVERSAQLEAIAHFANAIAIAGTAQDDPLPPASRLQLQIAYAQALIAVHSQAAPVMRLRARMAIAACSVA